MAGSTLTTNSSGWMQRIARYSTMAVPVSFIALLGVIVVPLHPMLMDMLVAANLSLAVVVLLTTVYTRSPLEFSVFPSLLLATTLFRLVLNVASTRLILSAEASTPAEAQFVAGRVIAAFGNFVAGGSPVVGVIIFIILIVVQFVVITKGSGRISEVAARFTLDGMPGKQMAIDADLNAGIIDENEARHRRETITREADFYGAMDGASKFVRGDAIAGIIITLINIFGGFAVGVFEKGWDMSQSLEIFTKLTIGDGLVSQIPSFVISIAAGLIVTRSSSDTDLGGELTDQLTGRPVVLGITAAFLGTMAFTGLPMVPMLALAGSIGAFAFFSGRNKDRAARNQAEAQAAKDTKAEAPPPIEKIMTVDTLELEVGYALVQLIDKSQGGDLLDRITLIRRQLALELGLVVPPVRIRDNMQLPPYEYHIKIRCNTIAQGTVYPGKFMAMDSGLATGSLQGQPTREPAFGLDAWWIDADQKPRAEALNFTVVDPSSVLATHLTEVVKNSADELLTREETNNLLEQLREKSPKLVEEVVPDLIKPGEIQKVLQRLLRERVPVRDMEAILETLSDLAPRTRDIDVLTEYVRNALRRTICNQYVEQDPETGANRLYCVTLDPAVEDMINGYIERGQQGTSLTMPPVVANRITSAVLRDMQKLIAEGHHPLVLASPQVRAQVRQIIEPHLSNVVVLGYNEISKGVEVESVGLVQLDELSSQSGSRLEGAVQ